MKWLWQGVLWQWVSFSVCLVHAWPTMVPFPRFPNVLVLWRQRQFQTICIPLPNDHHNGIAAADTAAVDSYMMQLALSQAQKAADRGEVPIGAVVVRPLPTTSTSNNNTSCWQILSLASNRVEEWQDASAHAELVALRQAARRSGTWRLRHATLYTTVEPCPLCLAAAQGFRVHRIVYGAPDLRVGAIDTYLHLLQIPHPYHTISHVTRGVGQDESATLLRTFFRHRRQQNQQKAAPQTTTPWQRIVLSWRRRRNKRE